MWDGNGPIRPTLQNCGPASVVSSVSDDRGRGWADTAHATELQSIFCSVVRIGRSEPGMGRYGPHYRTAAPSFLRLLRLFAAKPGPVRFRSGEELLPRSTRRGVGTCSENLLLSGHRGCWSGRCSHAATHSGFLQGARSPPLLMAPGLGLERYGRLRSSRSCDSIPSVP